MTQSPASQARNRLIQLAEKLQKERGESKSLLSLLSWEMYEALEKKIDFLTDEEIEIRLRRSIEEMPIKKLTRWEPVKRRVVK